MMIMMMSGGGGDSSATCILHDLDEPQPSQNEFLLPLIINSRINFGVFGKFV